MSLRRYPGFIVLVIGGLLLAAAVGFAQKPVDGSDRPSLRPFDSPSAAGTEDASKELVLCKSPLAPSPSRLDQSQLDGIEAPYKVPVVVESRDVVTAVVSANSAGSFDFDRYRRGPPSLFSV